ncbi:MAG: RidA family protein [Desulfobacterales bacterium]|jgi:enamine deaminase RidA (YjgF/YER057c/UK114 family)
MNKIEIQAGLPKTAGYLYAKRTGNQLHVSGQVPNNGSGEIIGCSDPYKQAQQCLANLELLLKSHNFEKNDIQHLTVYVVGQRENLTDAWRAVQGVFPNGVPPATLLGVALLGYENQLVEIDAKVVKDS